MRSAITLSALIVFQVITASSVWADNLNELFARSKYNTSQKEEIRELFQEAHKEGIPEELLFPRLVEGVAKKASAAKVLKALRQNLLNLKEARSILLAISGGEVLLENESSWLRTANLLAGRVPAEEIKVIAEACLMRPEDYRHASYLHVSLVDWGLERDVSLDLIKTILDSTLPGESFAGIPDLLAEGRRLRIASDEMVLRLKEELIANEGKEGIPRAKNLEDLRERILYK